MLIPATQANRTTVHLTVALISGDLSPAHLEHHTGTDDTRAVEVSTSVRLSQKRHDLSTAGAAALDPETIRG